ncbi:MAG: radical SAM family heme chaperone HemW [Acidobacteriota bacterium]
MRAKKTTLGLYLHVPFCRCRCTYCAFFTRPAGEPQHRRAYVDALAREIRHVAETGRDLGHARLPPQEGRVVDTIYIGGGTPSLLAPEQLRFLLLGIQDRFSVAPGAEVTLEANPETVTAAAADGWIAAGFNRVSLGAQTFDSSTLQALGRRHGPDTIVGAARSLRRAGLGNLSLDLIAGVNPGSWREDLERACALEPEHLSLYLLEVDQEETGSRTLLARQIERGQARVPEADWYADAYPEAVEILRSRGLERYEICNFSRPGHESRHNLKYWQNQDVLGFGPAASSLCDGVRFMVAADLGAYMKALEADAEPAVRVDAVDAPTRAAELFILGLRLERGINLEEMEARAGSRLRTGQRRALQRLARAGLLDREGDRLRLTTRGMLLSNEVFQAFLP